MVKNIMEMLEDTKNIIDKYKQIEDIKNSNEFSEFRKIESGQHFIKSSEYLLDSELKQTYELTDMEILALAKYSILYDFYDNKSDYKILTNGKTIETTLINIADNKFESLDAFKFYQSLSPIEKLSYCFYKGNEISFGENCWRYEKCHIKVNNYKLNLTDHNIAIKAYDKAIQLENMQNILQGKNSDYIGPLEVYSKMKTKQNQVNNLGKSKV